MIALCLGPAIAGTGYVNPNDPETQKRHAAAIQAAINGFTSTARTPAQHLAEYRMDVQACRRAFILLKNDKEFQNAILSGPSAEIPTWIDALKASQHSTAAPVQYLVRNSTRFQIDVDYHIKGMAANIDEIYCHPLTLIRLLKVEALGASQEGWEIRKEVLNSLLSDLDYPYIEGGDGLIPFDTLFKRALEAKAIYKSKYGEAYSNWINEAASTIRRNSRNAQAGAAGMTLKEQKQIISTWADRLLELSK